VSAVRSLEQVGQVLDLHDRGESATAISRLTGIPRATARDWVAGRAPRAAVPARKSCAVCNGAAHELLALPPAYCYLLGLYLGDGCISAHARGVYKLRIFLDMRYPGIVDACDDAMMRVLRAGKVSRLARRGSYTPERGISHFEVYSYSKSWGCLFPQHGPGRKHERQIELADWQDELVRRHPEQLLRGLIHSDGCRSDNTGRGGWRYPRYSFSNRSDDIRAIFIGACDLVGVRYTHAPNKVYVSRRADVDKLDEFIGPKA
jgi:hypothetical protein